MNTTGRYASGTATGILRHLRQAGLSHWTQRSSTTTMFWAVDADRSGAGGEGDGEVRAEEKEDKDGTEAKGGAVAAAVTREDIGAGVKSGSVDAAGRSFRPT